MKWKKIYEKVRKKNIQGKNKDLRKMQKPLSLFCRPSRQFVINIEQFFETISYLYDSHSILSSI